MMTLEVSVLFRNDASRKSKLPKNNACRWAILYRAVRIVSKDLMKFIADCYLFDNDVERIQWIDLTSLL